MKSICIIRMKVALYSLIPSSDHYLQFRVSLSTSKVAGWSVTLHNRGQFIADEVESFGSSFVLIDLTGIMK